MARVADHVYDHVLAVCRDASVARASTVEALARSPRAVSAALAHARPLALEAAGTVPDGGRPALDILPEGLLELAWLLAATRPAGERSVADLATRHGLDRAGLGRAMATSPSSATADADLVLGRWEAEFRPALVAFLGPAECEALRGVLGEEIGTRALGELLSIAAAVADHLDGCDVCGDRVRGMATVRSLLGQVPLAVAPPSLQPAGGPRRRRGPRRQVADADAGRPSRRDRRGRGRGRVVAAGATAGVVLGVVVAALVARGGGEDQVAVLTRVPARNALAAVPDEVTPGGTFLLESTVDHAVRWSVRPATPWLHTDPASGVLAPRRTSEVGVVVDPSAPEGPVRVDLAVSGDDGSSVLVRVRGSVEHAPTLAAAVDACTVTAQVEDESEIASVELRWRSGDQEERALPMSSAEGGYRADLPSASTRLRWWVTAVDGRGNRARSPERALAAC